jgi:hypothetical protein
MGALRNFSIGCGCGCPHPTDGDVRMGDIIKGLEGCDQLELMDVRSLGCTDAGIDALAAAAQDHWPKIRDIMADDQNVHCPEGTADVSASALAGLMVAMAVDSGDSGLTDSDCNALEGTIFLEGPGERL